MPRKTSSHKMSAPAAPAPAPAVPAPAPPQPNLVSTILQGFSFGAGQSLAYNTFRSDPKEPKEPKEIKEPKEPNPKNLSNCIKNEECNKLLESFLNMEFIQCMKDNKYEDCKHLM